MTWDDLRHEYRSEIIGELILVEVETAVHSVTRRFDSTEFAGVGTWRDAVDDVVQEAVTGLLLGDGQLDYMMSVCDGIDGFRRLMNVQVRRALTRNRSRTVIDNLVDRARIVLRQSPFTAMGVGTRAERYALGDFKNRRPTEGEIRGAALLAALVPRVGVGASERAPIVYADEHLRLLLKVVGEALPTWFELGDLDAILRSVLTDLYATVLEYLDEVQQMPTGTATVEDEVIVGDTVKEIQRQLTEMQRFVLLGKLAGVGAKDHVELVLSALIVAGDVHFLRHRSAPGGTGAVPAHERKDGGEADEDEDGADDFGRFAHGAMEGKASGA